MSDDILCVPTLMLRFSISKTRIGTKNATRDQQPSTIEIKRIEKVKDPKMYGNKKDRKA